MGTFRILLAFIVIVAHTMYPVKVPLLNGEGAVRLFFVVSGFYMALILTEKYVHGQPCRLWLFYSNRAMRILPLLWLAIAAEVGLAILLYHNHSLTAGHWLPIMEKLLHHDRIALTAVCFATQLSGFGVDNLFLISLTPDLHPSLYAGDLEGYVRGWQPCPLAHAWSISCELCFYLAAPFFIGLRTSLVSCLFAGSVVLLYVVPQVLSPPMASVALSYWSILQFPYFLLGILAYRVFHQRRTADIGIASSVRTAIVVSFGLCIAFYKPVASISFTLAQVVLFGLAAVSIPILFQRTHRSKLDRVIGDLSYPVYLVHITVKTALIAVGVDGKLGLTLLGLALYALLTFLISCGLSWTLLQLVDRPINRWRQSRISSGFINSAQA